MPRWARAEGRVWGNRGVALALDRQQKTAGQCDCWPAEFDSRSPSGTADKSYRQPWDLEMTNAFGRKLGPRQVDPTPQEIEAYCLEFQQRWAPLEFSTRKNTRLKLVPDDTFESGLRPSVLRGEPLEDGIEIQQISDFDIGCMAAHRRQSGRPRRSATDSICKRNHRDWPQVAAALGAAFWGATYCGSFRPTHPLPGLFGAGESKTRLGQAQFLATCFACNPFVPVPMILP